MKRIILSAGTILLLSAVVNAQQQTFDPYKNPTVAAITSQHPMKEIKHEDLTNEKVFPILGTYQPQAVNEITGTIHVSLDADNKGIVWIEGLPQGKVKAYMKLSPATYMIPEQKTDLGTAVPEGVVIYDPDSKKLSLCEGCGYDAKNPAGCFQENMGMKDENTNVNTEAAENATMHKTKKTKTTKVKEVKKPKPWIVYATKVESEPQAK